MRPQGSAVKAVVRYRRPGPECWDAVVTAVQDRRILADEACVRTLAAALARIGASAGGPAPAPVAAPELLPAAGRGVLERCPVPRTARTR
ncbi:hypothetical protein ACIPJK_06850 [Streptomyces roseus]|uniref:hypothetical protein n=1 Tax=Streptomyces roseus TaxID=66430 RepID=UPI0038044886